MVNYVNKKPISGYQQMLRDTAPRPDAVNTFVDDIVYDMTTNKNIARGAVNAKRLSDVAKFGSKAGRFATTWIPGVSDVYDIYSGGRKAFNKDANWKERAVGVGQMALGTAGLATLGGSSLLKTIAKYGAKSAMGKNAIKQLIKMGVSQEDAIRLARLNNMGSSLANKASNVANKVNRFVNNPVGNPATSIGLEVLGNIFKGPAAQAGEITPEQRKQLEKEFGKTNNNNKTNARYTSNGNGAYYRGSTGGGTSNITKPNSDNSNAQANTNTLSGGDVYDILNNWKDQQEYMKPYREGLAKYIQNYPELYRNAYARDMYLSGLGDLEGSSHMASMAGKYNPMTEQAKLLDLQKAMAGELQGADKDYQSLVGNLITAQRMGLNPNQVFANDKLLQLMNSNEIANAKLAQALQLAQARMALQQQLANQRISASYGNTASKNYNSILGRVLTGIFEQDPVKGLQFAKNNLGVDIDDDFINSFTSNPYDE